jgi:hypothetical protein
MSAFPSGDSLPAAEVDRLVDAGQAEPLVVGHRPVPVLWNRWWWCLLADAGEGGGYLPAPDDVAEILTDRHARLNAAAAAVASHDRARKGRS